MSHDRPRAAADMDPATFGQLCAAALTIAGDSGPATRSTWLIG